MTKKWAITREGGKNPKQKTLEKINIWIKNNRRLFLFMVLTAVALLIVGSYFTMQHKKLNEKSWEEISVIKQKVLTAKNFDNQQIYFTQIDELVKKYPNYPASAYALMLKGDILYESEQYKKAEDAYKQIISNKKFGKYIPFAINSLLYCYQSQNKEKDFLETAKSFVGQYKKHLLTPYIYMEIAGVYESSGETAKAKEIYKKLSVDFAKSPWGKTAGIVMEQSRLKNKGTQTSGSTNGKK